MNIRKEYPKVCLFLWILGMCFHAHPILAQSVIPVPLKMEQGTGSFYCQKRLNFIQTCKVEKRNSGRITESITCSAERSENERQETDAFLIDNPQDYPVAVTGKLYTLRHLSTNRDPGNFGSRIILWNANPVTADATGKHRQLFRTLCRDRRHPSFCLSRTDAGRIRHFSTKEFIKKQIDALAYYKINRLHLHRPMRQAGGLKSRNTPLLTDFAAWRTDPTWKKWWNGGRKYLRYDEPGASGGYYTQDDIREILEYARQHYITVIPEIEMPSHSEEVLAAYPQLSCSGEPYKNSDFCVGNEETFTFLENVLTEVMELFPSEYIHVGGDDNRQIGLEDLSEMSEENERRASGQCRRAAKLSDTPYRKVPQQSRTPSLGMGRDSARRYRAQCNRYVVAWRRGWYCCRHLHHHAIMTPGAYCYLDSYRDAPYSQPEAIGGYLPLKKVYAYDPVPASLTAEQAKLVYGVQGNLWVEYIPTPEHVEYMIYPRMLALAEVAWSAPERKVVLDFHTRALSAVVIYRKKDTILSI